MHPSLITDWIHQIQKGDRTALSKAITLVESAREEDQQLAKELLKANSLPLSTPTCRIGITGSPGVGKSSLIEILGLLILQQGNKVAVLTIDPSSSIHMGSILGDKSRMPQLSQQKNAFIRPSASSNVLGGISKHTRSVIQLMELAGFDRVIIESVGVGQSEFDIGLISDILLYLVQPAAGDELQAMKKGIMEWADVFVIHKSDGVLEKLANETMSGLLAGNQTQRIGSDHHPSNVLKTSIFKEESIVDLLDHINHIFNVLNKENKLFKNRLKKDELFFEQHWRLAISDALLSNVEFKQVYNQIKLDLLSGNINVENAFEQLIKFIFAFR